MLFFRYLRTALLGLALVSTAEAGKGPVNAAAGAALLICSAGLAAMGVTQIVDASGLFDPGKQAKFAAAPEAFHADRERVARAGVYSLGGSVALGVAGYVLLGDGGPPRYPSLLSIDELPEGARVQVNGETVAVQDGAAAITLLLAPGEEFIVHITIQVGDRQFSGDLDMVGGKPRKVSFSSFVPE